MPKFQKPLAGLFVLLLALAPFARAEEKIEFQQETLANGLRVIYAPLRQAPVVHVRVLYHVGSRDERPDRQGFAHMFEHMMFRGSAHVAPEQHMKLISMVGGSSNAFTSFDQTVYINTVPANQVELALYLEADRMASFKVSDEIYQIERNVVMEEWRRRQNQPYGSMFEDFFKLMYTTHSYQWTPIGNMDHLKAAHVSELQEFFNTYYVPNNAVLVIAGDIDVAAARAMVQRYFAWIPKGDAVQRTIPAEPEQTEPRSSQVNRTVRLPALLMGYRVPPYRSDDHYAISLLATILSGGESARLDRVLVNGASPLCAGIGAFNYALEDGGYFAIRAMPLAGKDPVEIKQEILKIIAELAENGVTAEELAKAKLKERKDFVKARETAEAVASAIGSEALFAGDPNRVNTVMAKLNAVTAADVQTVAKKYLSAQRLTTLTTLPGAADEAAAGAVVPAQPREVKPRPVTFPASYPAQPPLNTESLKASFAKGTDALINGVKVIIMPDPRLPQVTWGLTMRSGSHAEPNGKSGLASLTAAMVRRGAAGMSYEQLNEDLESRGISLGVGESGDYARLSGSALPEYIDHAIQRSRQVLLQPNFEPAEFAKLKEQTLSGLKLAEGQPETAASQELAKSVFAGTPLQRYPTPASVSAITLDDIKAFYQQTYIPNDAILTLSGDITVERGQELARKLLDGWQPATLPRVDYGTIAEPKKLQIILVDRPEGKQSMIRMATRAYDITSDEKFAGSLASGILSAGINSRLGKSVRAEKGLVYSVWGYFQPARQGGQFIAGAETGLKTTADTIQAMFDVFTKMGREGVTTDELKEAQLRTVGGMVMGMQTADQLARYRVDGLLNNYPIDYYDLYGERISAVPATQVGEVVAKYLKPQRMTVVVVAPAADVKAQLEKLGDVTVVPMPGKEEGGMR